MTAPKYCSQYSLLQALLWLQQSPPLFSPEASVCMAKTALPETIPLYTPDQQALEYLKNRLASKPWLPLGIYYENLWQFLIEQHPDMELLAHNMQVIQHSEDVRSTLGEYDLIYRFNKKVIHRELAVKFYLGVPHSSTTTSPWQYWVGPGLKDRLDRKMHRLLNHQIRLSDTREGRDALTGFGANPVEKEVLIQGRLFYPMFAHCLPPEGINPEHLRGCWLTLSDYEQWLSEQPPADCKILKKPFWLDNDDGEKGTPLTEHLHALSQNKLPQMIKYQDLYLFVVPDDWPERAIHCTEAIG